MLLEVENEDLDTPVKPAPCPTLGWRFTDDELKRIRRSCQKAKLFMKHYGKGMEPIMVDRSHYYTSDNPFIEQINRFMAAKPTSKKKSQ